MWRASLLIAVACSGAGGDQRRESPWPEPAPDDAPAARTGAMADALEEPIERCKRRWTAAYCGNGGCMSPLTVVWGAQPPPIASVVTLGSLADTDVTAGLLRARHALVHCRRVAGVPLGDAYFEIAPDGGLLAWKMVVDHGPSEPAWDEAEPLSQCVRKVFEDMHLVSPGPESSCVDVLFHLTY